MGTMVVLYVPALRQLRWIMLGLLVVLGGCYAGYWTYTYSGGGSEAAVGEQHDVDYPAPETFKLVQDVLRGEGVLYDVKPNLSLVTMWRHADKPPGLLPGLIGVEPRYRFEIQVVPLTAHTSRIIVNVRGEDMAREDLSQYKAAQRLDLFNKFDQLAQQFPPTATAPCPKGVIFFVLPNEDLKALAKRATGDESKWKQIAKDNAISSPTELAGVRSVCVRANLIGQKSAPAPDASAN